MLILYEKDCSKTTSIASLYQEFNEKYGLMITKNSTAITKLQKRQNDDDENINFEDAADDVSFKVQSLTSPLESMKSRILFSSFQQYEEICDFVKLTPKNNPFTTNSSCFERVTLLSTLNCTTPRERKSFGSCVGRRIFTEGSEK